MLFQVVSITDNTTYKTITVTYLSSNNTFTNASNITFSIARMGPTGPSGGPVGPTGTSGPTGWRGETGLTGPTGLAGGYSFYYTFNTLTTVSPSSGEIRFNNATYSSVSSIYIHYNDRYSVNLSTVLGSLSAGDTLKVFNENNPIKFAIFRFVSITDNVTYKTLTVTYVTSNSNFSTSDNVAISISRIGSLGQTGPSGGPVGPTGTTGPTGRTGDPGGPTGPTGPTGISGEIGPTGNIGPTGESGGVGPTGTSGSTGEPGPQGEIGPMGMIGPIGITGTPGPKGSTGDTGPTGPSGNIGPTGPQSNWINYQPSGGGVMIYQRIGNMIYFVFSISGQVGTSVHSLPVIPSNVGTELWFSVGANSNHTVGNIVAQASIICNGVSSSMTLYKSGLSGVTYNYGFFGAYPVS